MSSKIRLEKADRHSSLTLFAVHEPTVARDAVRKNPNCGMQLCHDIFGGGSLAGCANDFCWGGRVLMGKQRSNVRPAGWLAQ